jgi:hypothetical protein
MLVLVAAAVLFEATVRSSLPAVAALSPVKAGVRQYGFFLLLLLTVHFSFSDTAQTLQRFELFLVPLVVGAFASLTDRHFAVLKVYVIATSLLAVAWPFVPGLGQKNPVGQMISGAILLLLGVKSLRGFVPFAVILVPALFLTGSRGSVIATAVGALAILALQESRARALFARLTVVSVIAFVAYALLPATLQTRLTSFSAGTGSRGAYALEVRQQYIKDARRIIRAHPVTGIGVGNYVAGDPRNLTATTDPHNVLLLQAAEGGYGFALSFSLMIVAILVGLRRMRNVELAPIAAAVLVSTFVHGLVDIYWVRGTPVLGWLLVGMACGEHQRRRQSSHVAA